ncbi:FMN-binding negative transcriptional regulator [Nocardioides mangrovicus]|uniref:FMN-binding negative transcriptional regulator n=1 Tax=Nocardioides mangrovicus TaxID=2478913 RepID=A0A3L8NY97_9ACTN|nr:FMN-binding negative transcriptional regulator [Nocardioides mangrovicus]RLV47904.1 FMN-binding negative transcriptional regulator [Nocardioides mangrovicus]
MYVPRFNAWEDAEEVRALVASVGSTELVTVGPDGYPLATLLPVVWDGDRLLMHMARANQHWRAIAPGTPALAVVAGEQAYVSPGWYASKTEHGRVVPTWNYSAVHLSGRVTVHDDPAWLREAVTVLTRAHEEPRAQPWHVTDAPATYVDKQLRAIVGVELVVERVEAKQKLSQNRSEADRAGVVAGLRGEGGSREVAVAQQMAQQLAEQQPAD